ncbi:MAG: metallopeptidase TldD-related protein [Dehalococcoidia bacterium]
MEQFLEEARKVCQEAEVFFVTHKSTPVSFEANRLKSLETNETRGIALRIVKDGRIGFAASNNLEDVKGLVDRAVEVAPFGAEAKFTLPSSNSYPSVEVYDPEVEAVTVEQMVELGQSLVDGVRKHTPEILCDAGVTQSVTEVNIINSRGGQTGYKKSVFGLGLEGTLIRGTDMLFVGDGQSSCRPITEHHSILKKVHDQLDMAKETAHAPSGEVPVIFTPHGVAAALLSPLSMAFNGKTVLQGASPLVGKLGQKLCDDRFSLWDDATLNYRPGSRPCDDEGVPTQRIPLIERGVVGSFLYDLQTAAQAKAQSTGSASRGMGSLPSPSTSLLIIDEGDVSYEDMLSDVKEGLVVERLLGVGQSNVLGGDFSGNVLLGYKVEQGRVVGRVKNTMISGNVYEALNNLVAIGKEGEWVGGSLRLPPLYCRNISVSRKE